MEPRSSFRTQDVSWPGRGPFALERQSKEPGAEGFHKDRPAHGETNGFGFGETASHDGDTRRAVSQIDKCSRPSSFDIKPRKTEVNTIYAELSIPLQQTRVDVFGEIFLVFLALGTLVGVVVVAYIMYNAYKYRDVEADETDDVDRPTLGELPVGGQGGKKLFLSFGLSAIIVVSLIIWTYGMLLYVEDGPDQLEGDDHVEIDVEAFAFGFQYDYGDDDISMSNDLIIPADEPVEVHVTSTDVWHTFGISQERVKADAIPGEEDTTWFVAEETGVFENAVECFELCGDGHSAMQHDLTVIDGDLYHAIVDEGAMDEFEAALAAGDLTVDSDPEDLDAYLEAQEEEEDDEDEEDDDENDEDDHEEDDEGEDDDEGGDD